MEAERVQLPPTSLVPRWALCAPEPQASGTGARQCGPRRADPPLPTLEHFAVLEQCFQNFNVHESLEDLVTEQILIQ